MHDPWLNLHDDWWRLRSKFLLLRSWRFRDAVLLSAFSRPVSVFQLFNKEGTAFRVGHWRGGRCQGTKPGCGSKTNEPWKNLQSRCPSSLESKTQSWCSDKLTPSWGWVVSHLSRRTGQLDSPATLLYHDHDNWSCPCFYHFFKWFCPTYFSDRIKCLVTNYFVAYTFKVSTTVV